MDPKQQLQKLINDLKTKQFRDGEAKGLVQTIGEEIKSQLSPAFKGLAEDMKSEMVSSFKEAVNSIKIDVPEIQAPQVTVNVPDIQVPDINVPQPKVTVNVPKADTPIVNVPAPIVNFPSEMGLKRDAKPFPVMMVDQVGKPMQFPISGGVSGGRGDFFTIKDIQNSTGGSIIDNDGNVKVAGSFSVTASNSSTQAIDSSGNVYNQANPFPVTVVSGGSATTGSALVDSSGIQYSGSNPLPVTFTGSSSTSVSIVNSDGTYYNSDNPLPVSFSASGTTQVQQVSGAVDSINILQYGGVAVPTGLNETTAGVFRVVQMTDSISSVSATQAGTWNIATLTGVTNSLAVVALDRDGNPLTTGPIAQGDSATALRVVIAGNSDASVTATQSGTWNVGTVTTVTGITNSTQSALIDSSGVQYSGSNPVPITWVSGAGVSTTVNIGDSSGVGYSGSNPLPVYMAGTATATTSVNVVDSTGVAFEGANPFPISGAVTQSGTWNIGTVTTVTGVTNSLAANIVDSSGVAYTTSNPLPIGDAGGSLTVDGTVTVSSVTNSVSSAITDSSGVQYSGSNPFPVTLANTGSTQNVLVTGASDSFLAYEVMTTNKTAKSDGADIRAKADDIGRQITRPVQARDLMATAYVSLATGSGFGTETTLLAAGGAGVFHDLIFVLGTNDSDAAVTASLRDVTGGNVVTSIQIPAYATSGVSIPVPYPQGNANNNWTVDLPDLSGTNVTLTALFSKEI